MGVYIPNDCNFNDYPKSIKSNRAFVGVSFIAVMGTGSVSGGSISVVYSLISNNVFGRFSGVHCRRNQRTKRK